MVAVYYLDDRLAEIGELQKQLVLHLAKLAVDDFPGIPLFVVAVDEQLLVQRELRGKEGVDESHVVVVLAHLENLLAPLAQLAVPRPASSQIVALVPLLAEAAAVPAILDVAKQLEPDLVGIDRPGAGSHR